MARPQKYFLLFIFFVAPFIFVSNASAATLYLLPEAQMFGIGQEFTIDLKVNTEDESINAVQAVIRFPTNILELISIDKDNSAFSFWVEEPTLSNEDGTARFVGGTSKGISGSSLQILRMRFRASGAGSAEISVSDAVVAASDGKGTNVLSTIEGTSVGVGTEVVEPTPVPTPEPVEQPQRVVREAVLAKDLPEKPVLRVPLYPDELEWYNHLGEVVVFWELPPDVVQIATRLSRSRDLKPGDKKEELFTGENFGVLEEGIWYVRVQFKNNVGWGELAFYKISIDTVAPVPFEIEIDSEISDDPSPEVRYGTQDGLSGIAGYLISVDGKGPIRTSSSSIVLSPQAPGTHRIVVRALDFAGNSVEDDLEFEVLPLPAPTVLVKSAFIQEELIFAAGETTPSAFVDVQMVNEKGREVFKGVVESNEIGYWRVIIDEPLARGDYALFVNARDSRGAVSFRVQQSVKIKARPIVSVAFVELGWLEILLIVVVLMVVSNLYYLIRRHLKKKKS